MTPRSKRPCFVQVAWQRVTQGTDFLPAGQTRVPCRMPRPRQSTALGMSQTGHKVIPTARRKTECNAAVTSGTPAGKEKVPVDRRNKRQRPKISTQAAPGAGGHSHKECGHHPALQTSRSGWGRGVTDPRKRCLSTYRDHPLQCHTVRMPASRLGKLRFGDGRPLVRGPRVGQRQSQDSNPHLPHSQALTKV